MGRGDRERYVESLKQDQSNTWPVIVETGKEGHKNGQEEGL